MWKVASFITAVILKSFGIVMVQKTLFSAFYPNTLERGGVLCAFVSASGAWMACV
jgi:cation transporter-like permease